VDGGRRVADVAAFFGNDPSTIYRWRRQRARTGSGVVSLRSGRPSLLAPGQAAELDAQVAAHPDATLSQALRAVGDGAWRPAVALSHDPLGARAWVHARKKTLIAREQDADARAAWRKEVATLDSAQLIFLDETSTPTNLTPRFARARRGQRVLGRVPQGRWTSVTLLASLIPDGFGPGLQFAGALDRPTFDAFVVRILVPASFPARPSSSTICRSTRAPPPAG